MFLYICHTRLYIYIYVVLLTYITHQLQKKDEENTERTKNCGGNFLIFRIIIKYENKRRSIHISTRANTHYVLFEGGVMYISIISTYIYIYTAFYNKKG